MKDNKNKAYLIILAIVVVLALAWFLVLGNNDSDTDDSNQPATPQQDQQQAAADGDQQPAADGSGDADSGDQGADPQTDLGKEAAAVLALHQEILAIQQQYSDSCPTEEVVLDVSGRFEAANAAGVALAGNIAASTDQAATAEALMYQQQIGAVAEQLVSLGPEILDRCDLGHLVPVPQ